MRKMIVPLEDRSALIVRYENGETLAQIGASYGISREAVRQLLAKMPGYSRRRGGVAIQRRRVSEDRRQSFAEAKEAKSVRSWGCCVADAVAANGGFMPRTNDGALGEAYREQKENAGRRGIPWEFTFPAWVKEWQISGFLDRRGRGVGRYVMCRIADRGAYSPGNVYFAENGGEDGNISHYWKVKRGEVDFKI
jgi:hypothetical protein